MVETFVGAGPGAVGDGPGAAPSGKAIVRARDGRRGVCSLPKWFAALLPDNGGPSGASMAACLNLRGVHGGAAFVLSGLVVSALFWSGRFGIVLSGREQSPSLIPVVSTSIDGTMAP